MEDMKQVRAMVRKLVKDTADSGAIGHVTFFTAQALSSFGEIEGEGADFYTICAQITVTQIVKDAVGKYDKPESDTPILAGFTHLRIAYPVHRNGEHLLVPVDKLTDQEIDLRCSQYQEAADGYIAHIEEFQTFKRARAIAS
jgi:hypothetical protein